MPSLDHTYQTTSQRSRHSLRNINPSQSDVRMGSPDLCPECHGDKRKAQDHEKERAREECQEAITAHKAHSEFLSSQVANTNNPELKNVFKKMLNDSRLMWATKVQELVADYESLEGPREAHNVTFEKSLEEVENMIDMMVTKVGNKYSPRAILQSKEWYSLRKEYKGLRNVYEEKTKQGFEDVATKLEAIRRKASALIKD